MTLPSPPSTRPVDMLSLLRVTPPQKRIMLLFLSACILVAMLGTGLILVALANPYTIRDEIQNLSYLITSISMMLAIVFWRVHANRSREYHETYQANLRSVPQAILIRASHSPELPAANRRAILDYLNRRDPGWSLTEEAQRDGALPMPEEKDTRLERLLGVVKALIPHKS